MKWDPDSVLTYAVCRHFYVVNFVYVFITVGYIHGVCIMAYM